MSLHEGPASSESLLWNVQLNSLSLNSSPSFFYKENDMVARPWATALDQLFVKKKNPFLVTSLHDLGHFPLLSFLSALKHTNTLKALLERLN